MEYLLAGINTLLTDPFCWFLIIAGMFMGIVFGCIPGLTATPVSYTHLSAVREAAPPS